VTPAQFNPRQSGEDVTYIIEDSRQNLSVDGRHVLRLVRNERRTNEVYNRQFLGGQTVIRKPLLRRHLSIRPTAPIINNNNNEYIII